MISFPLDHDAVVASFPDLSLDAVPLGIGGMKNAYRGQVDGDPIVLKVIREPLEEETEGGPSVPERVARELEGMRRVDHQNVVPILDGPDVTSVDGAERVWYLEPFFDSGTLDDHMVKPWPEIQALDLATDLLSAVEALWDAQIIHRDIKPANIAIRKDGSAVLLDLGIALILDLTTLTEDWEQSPMTPRYAAPEQFELRRLAKIDFRTDLFLIGMVLFEVLVGVHPFRPNDAEGYKERLVTGALDEQALQAAGLSECVVGFLRRLLAPRPSQRFRRVAHAQEELETCR